MRFVKISSPNPVIEYLTVKILAALDEGKRVLWLVPGGSCIPLVVETSKLLSIQDLKDLVVGLTDERFGPTGHADSNWQQLKDAGFELTEASCNPVLDGAGISLASDQYGAWLNETFLSVDYKLGFFGLGPDGHTAGILPRSSSVHEKKFSSSYDTETFDRITMTPPAIEQLDEAVVYAIGVQKWPVLDQLEDVIDIDTQPAQALKKIAQLTIFNDYKGEEL